MNRFLTLIAATAAAALAVSSACFAGVTADIRYAFEDSSRNDGVQLRLTSDFDGKKSGNWTRGFALAELPGLTAEQARSARATPARFAILRPAGRLDCSGTAGRGVGKGQCALTTDPRFAAMLAAKGFGTPTPKQAYALAMSGVSAEAVEALAAAGYPRPDIDGLVAIGIFDIDPAYIRAIAAAGYRLKDSEELVAFKIHKVTPDLIKSYRALGYDQLGSDDLLAMSIHQVTPEFIGRFTQLGYRALSADQLVQLRIFNVTADDVRALQARGIARPSVDQLVQNRIFGGAHRPGK